MIEGIWVVTQTQHSESLFEHPIAFFLTEEEAQQYSRLCNKTWGYNVLFDKDGDVSDYNQIDPGDEDSTHYYEYKYKRIDKVQEDPITFGYCLLDSEYNPVYGDNGKPLVYKEYDSAVSAGENSGNEYEITLWSEEALSRYNVSADDLL